MTFAATIPNVTDLVNLDVTNLTDNVPILLRTKYQWYILEKNSNQTIDDNIIFNANTGVSAGRWKAINVTQTSVDVINATPQNTPTKVGQSILCLSSMRFFIATDTNNSSDWQELPFKAVNMGEGNPTSLSVIPRFEGDFFVDTANNRLFIAIDNSGLSWTNIPITDGKTNISLTPSTISSAPEYIGNMVILSNPERIYLSTGTTDTNDWLLLKTNQVSIDDVNTEPQSAPLKENDVKFFLQNGKIYLATGKDVVGDWQEFVTFSFDVVANDPTPVSGVRKFIYNSVKKQLWIADGTNTTLIGDISNKRNVLELDVENYSEYTNFINIDGDIGIQIYWHPLNIPYHYYDGTQIVYYDITQFAHSPWTNTGGTSANDKRAKYITNTEINNARTTNGGSGKIDLSDFLKTNGVGNYFFIPTMLSEANDTYRCIGEDGDPINLGLEFINNEFGESSKILDFKYDNVEFNLTSPPTKQSTIKGAFSSYDLASSVYTKTLSGGIKFLQISSFPVDSIIQLKPYELLTNYGNFYA